MSFSAIEFFAQVVRLILIHKFSMWRRDRTLLIDNSGLEPWIAAVELPDRSHGDLIFASASRL